MNHSSIMTISGLSPFVGQRSNVTLVTLDGFLGLERFRFLCFLILLPIYVFVLLSDSVVIYLICSQSSLHAPMHVFIAALLLNSLLGSTTVYPRFLVDLLAASHLMSHAACLAQAFLIYFLGLSGFTLLSAMAYDRYMCICRPLRYPSLVTMAVVRGLLSAAWLLPATLAAGATLLAGRAPVCHHSMKRVYCNIYSIVKLGCGDTLVGNGYGLMSALVCVLLPIIFVVFSYVRILLVCLHNSRVFARKAAETCLPHLFVLISYSVSAVFELISSRFDDNLHDVVPTVVSILIMVIPSLCNPIIYGLKMKEIFKHVKKLVSPNAV